MRMFSDKTIEEYQLILLRNPSAKVFAPLAEAYRKMGLLQQALEICEKGVKYNPQYPSGLVAYGKILFELKRYEQACEIFRRATDMKPDNILAHKLNALSLIKLNNYAQALAAYKKVLYLNPQDAQAQKFIASWEYLEAPGYSKETFIGEPSPDHELVSDSDPSHVSTFIEALIARNEIDRARLITKTSLDIWPEDPQLLKHLEVINESVREEVSEHAKTELHQLRIKKNFLLSVLRRIELAKRVDHNGSNPFNTTKR